MSFDRRIVVDTGVLVSAAIRPQSVPALALQKALLLFEVCVSDATAGELRRVLGRSKFDPYLAPAKREDFTSGFLQHATTLVVENEVTDCIDPEDNKFLALADAAGAELILASDPHLTNMNPWRGMLIIPPADFLVMSF